MYRFAGNALKHSTYTYLAEERSPEDLRVFQGAYEIEAGKQLLPSNVQRQIYLALVSRQTSHSVTALSLPNLRPLLNMKPKYHLVTSTSKR